ncbi:hypothetical protein U5801_16480 [Lamprobacter modestohalophilus]|uniref:hypothetical protein n=1 Tax=Lamprobacter modestohalophilus TaxID=1064514 RepID=UPI002ADEE767|nr:hypothetical protein [Lamprobacter modestohalophilus]MCF7979577.1 hypothetical protein [Chromatiaceae bacterium]MCF7995835.1 hypothetical protein [Chromatiaceae bacterium]MCF8005537.1 hypothetical protein [Chromatiaceae bacterium]MEA1051391.1 hypothetical protein [Lamprobacter modestohalophilus]
MDNQVLRETYSTINERYCPFEKSILTNQCACSRAERFCIAEREGVSCETDEAQARCVRLLELLRGQARFALRTTDGSSALPHAKAMRVQVGGLRGLYLALNPDAEVPKTIDDVDAIITAAVSRFGSLDHLPFQVIVQQITAYRGRRPFRDRRS